MPAFTSSSSALAMSRCYRLSTRGARFSRSTALHLNKTKHSSKHSNLTPTQHSKSSSLRLGVRHSSVASLASQNSYESISRSWQTPNISSALLRPTRRFAHYTRMQATAITLCDSSMLQQPSCDFSSNEGEVALHWPDMSTLSATPRLLSSKMPM